MTQDNIIDLGDHGTINIATASNEALSAAIAKCRERTPEDTKRARSWAFSHFSALVLWQEMRASVQAGGDGGWTCTVYDAQFTITGDDFPRIIAIAWLRWFVLPEEAKHGEARE
jgi:hypothetical protein